MTVSPAMAALSGEPLSLICHCDEPSATGPAAVTQFHTSGHGLKTFVRASTTRVTMAKIAM
jgi:hypothetical protein